MKNDDKRRMKKKLFSISAMFMLYIFFFFFKRYTCTYTRKQHKKFVNLRMRWLIMLIIIYRDRQIMC